MLHCLFPIRRLCKLDIGTSFLADLVEKKLHDDSVSTFFIFVAARNPLLVISAVDFRYNFWGTGYDFWPCSMKTELMLRHIFVTSSTGVEMV